VSKVSALDLRETLAAWAARKERWAPLTRHDPDERTYTLLHRDDEVELYVVCWMSGHDTGFHDHDESAAAITVLEGALSEERLALTGTVETTLAEGDMVTIAREAIHRVRHAGHAAAVSLHAYSPPLQRVRHLRGRRKRGAAASPAAVRDAARGGRLNTEGSAMSTSDTVLDLRDAHLQRRRVRRPA
jgi:quercetin dioxygenase-like cupin family protein